MSDLTEMTFEQMPGVIEQINRKVENIERLLLKKTHPETDQLLTVSQAAELLCLSVNTIYGYVQRAEIPVCKRSKRLYFSKQDLIDWIKSGRKKTIPEIEQEANHYLIGRGEE